MAGKISRIVQVKFTTEDGKEHPTEQAARLHLIETEAYDAINNLIEDIAPNRTEVRKDAVIKFLLLEEESIRAILLKLHQRKPKGEIVPLKVA